MQDEMQGKRAKRMQRVDNMPHGLRECVHEYGLTIVDAMTDCGVTNPRHIHHLVRTIRHGSYQKAADGAAPRDA